MLSRRLLLIILFLIKTLYQGKSHDRTQPDIQQDKAISNLVQWHSTGRIGWGWIQRSPETQTQPVKTKFSGWGNRTSLHGLWDHWSLVGFLLFVFFGCWVFWFFGVIFYNIGNQICVHIENLINSQIFKALLSLAKFHSSLILTLRKFINDPSHLKNAIWIYFTFLIYFLSKKSLNSN